MTPMLTRPQFWKDNYDQIIRAAKRISMRKLATCPITSVALAEKWLMEDADKLRTKFFKVIQTVLNTMKKEPDSADAELKHKLGKVHLSCTTRRTKATTVTLKEDESDEFLKIRFPSSISLFEHYDSNAHTGPRTNSPRTKVTTTMVGMTVGMTARMTPTMRALLLSRNPAQE
ncbi:hypothetical protein NXS19_008348 [Fusarium pseudograminearum]|nr:hypothetical protein NXS19_008348 [Fusarium pseudograminearum]